LRSEPSSFSLRYPRRAVGDPASGASPAATVGQTIGITDVAITYHRPR